MANAVAPDLRKDGVAIVNVDPGFTRTELVELLGERGVMEPEAAGSMDLTSQLVVRFAEDQTKRCGSAARSSTPRNLTLDRCQR